MEPIDLVLLLASVVLALLSRSMMKRSTIRKMGRSNDALLEIDFWRATRGEPLARGLLAVEIASWLACLLLAATLAAKALG
jgi:hypothetical protein